jgi:hypothetical protein
LVGKSQQAIKAVKQITCITHPVAAARTRTRVQLMLDGLLPSTHTFPRLVELSLSTFSESFEIPLAGKTSIYSQGVVHLETRSETEISTVEGAILWWSFVARLYCSHEGLRSVSRVNGPSHQRCPESQPRTRRNKTVPSTFGMDRHTEGAVRLALVRLVPGSDHLRHRELMIRRPN